MIEFIIGSINCVELPTFAPSANFKYHNKVKNGYERIFTLDSEHEFAGLFFIHVNIIVQTYARRPKRTYAIILNTTILRFFFVSLSRS